MIFEFSVTWIHLLSLDSYTTERIVESVRLGLVS